MCKRLSKAWAWLEHIHTGWWFFGIMGGAGMTTSIARYITNHYSYLDLIVFCVSTIILSIPFFISRYTRKTKIIKFLRNAITEIEGQTILFDSDNWPKYQKICVDWGDKVAPLIKPDKGNYEKFTNALGRLRAVIHKPILPSDFSGVPKQRCFNEMISIAKQRLHELEL
jgi:hypothetical protein